ncbi:hypothetical protein [Nocardia sp. A7]|uniref:hypothetical protein n=1 Tax=Nocardia sp. A7 TaxID=2789274 RepID=UPI0039793417
MPGIVTQFAIADLVLEARRAAGEPVPEGDDLRFFYLGAAGLQLAELLPAKTELAAAEPNSRVFAAWLPVLRLLAGTPTTPGLYGNLVEIRGTLEWLRGLAEQADVAAKVELIKNRDRAERLRDLVPALSGQLATVPGLLGGFAATALSAGPQASDGTSVLGSYERWKSRPPEQWRPRATVHGSRTGKFLQELRRLAKDSGDSRLLAFVDGYTVANAAALSGKPFLNGVVGGPHRNQWWRHTWVANYIDTWSWGYVNKRRAVRAEGAEIVFTASNSLPNPRLRYWDNACGSELQDRIRFGNIDAPSVLSAIANATALPAELPPQLVTLWLDAYTSVYGPPLPAAGIDAGGVHSAYSLTWLTLWLKTSQQFLPEVPPERINLPDNCGAKPPWVDSDGSVFLPDGQVVQPPEAPSGSVSVAEIASAIAAVVLAALNYAMGNVVVGSALIVGAVERVDEATPPDWDELLCHLEWVEVYLTNFSNSIRQLLVAAGLALPYTSDLEHNVIQFSPLGGGQIWPVTAALNTCRSAAAAENGYPRSMWKPAGGASTWPLYPSEAPEPPVQVSAGTTLAWPLIFLDGWTFTDNGVGTVPRYTGTQSNPLALSGALPTVLDADEWRRRVDIVTSGQGALDVSGFGNAVDLARALLDANPDETPYLDWDLDADRGLGWPAWIWRDQTGSPGDVLGGG